MIVASILLTGVLAGTPGAGLPAGWVTLAPNEPSKELVECAGQSDLEWKVLAREGRVVIEKDEADHGDPLPFPLKTSAITRVAPVVDGFLIGFDEGEFGGGLHWFNKDGTKHASITVPKTPSDGPDNVKLMLRVGDDVLALEGLHHMGEDTGMAVLVSAKPGHAARRMATLRGAPLGGTMEDATHALVATGKGVERVSMDGKVTSLLDAPPGDLYPSSIALASPNLAYVGMRHFVARIDLTTKTRPTWLVPAQCARWRHHDGTCECLGPR